MSETTPDPVAAEPETPETPEPAPVPEVPANPPVETSTTGTSNESPVLPPSAQAAAARAHALLGHFVTMAQAIQGDLAKYVPPGMLSAAEVEVASIIRAVV